MKHEYNDSNFQDAVQTGKIVNLPDGPIPLKKRNTKKRTPKRVITVRMPLKNLCKGDYFFTMGLDINCNPVRVKAKFIKHYEENKYLVTQGGLNHLFDGNEEVKKIIK
jgi:hypothetical protein